MGWFVAECLYCLGTIIAAALFADMRQQRQVPAQRYWMSVLTWPVIALLVILHMLTRKSGSDDV